MIDDMRSWFGRAEFDPLWVLRRFWFVEEEDQLRLSQMNCYSELKRIVLSRVRDLLLQVYST